MKIPLWNEIDVSFSSYQLFFFGMRWIWTIAATSSFLDRSNSEGYRRNLQRSDNGWAGQFGRRNRCIDDHPASRLCHSCCSHRCLKLAQENREGWKYSYLFHFKHINLGVFRCYAKVVRLQTSFNGSSFTYDQQGNIWHHYEQCRTIKLGHSVRSWLLLHLFRI